MHKIAEGTLVTTQMGVVPVQELGGEHRPTQFSIDDHLTQHKDDAFIGLHLHGYDEVHCLTYGGAKLFCSRETQVIAFNPDEDLLYTTCVCEIKDDTLLLCNVVDFCSAFGGIPVSQTERLPREIFYRHEDDGMSSSVCCAGVELTLVRSKVIKPDDLGEADRTKKLVSVLLVEDNNFCANGIYVVTGS